MESVFSKMILKNYAHLEIYMVVRSIIQDVIQIGGQFMFDFFLKEKNSLLCICSVHVCHCR